MRGANSRAKSGQFHGQNYRVDFCVYCGFRGRTYEHISTVSVIFSKNAGALQVPEQMAPLRPLFGHESIGRQWRCTDT